jgi:hypothetical protein
MNIGFPDNSTNNITLKYIFVINFQSEQVKVEFFDITKIYFKVI